MKVNDIFSNWTEEGIFTYLNQLEVPWKDSADFINLNLFYHGNFSGDKNISPLLFKMHENNESDLFIKIANVIFTLYNFNWKKEWDTLNLTYNPIENYNMEENLIDDLTTIKYGKENTEERNLSQNESENSTTTPENTLTIKTDNKHTKTGDETRSPNLTITTTPDLTNTSSSSIYAFNSEEEVPVNSNLQQSTGNSINETKGNEIIDYDLNEIDDNSTTQTNGGTIKEERSFNSINGGNVTYKDSGEDTHEHSYKLTRTGNIGVTTSQQMLESERRLWEWSFFKDIVFKDIDNVLTLSIY